MTALAERTGMIGFARFTRGHVHDKTVPTETQSWDALEFFPDILKKESHDIGAQFELWSMAREKGDTGVDTLRSMRKEITKYNQDGVQEKLGKSKKVAINWVQYSKVMILEHGIRLRGWPLDGDPVNPNNIHDIDSITKVCNAMRDQIIY